MVEAISLWWVKMAALVQSLLKGDTLMFLVPFSIRALTSSSFQHLDTPNSGSRGELCRESSSQLQQMLLTTIVSLWSAGGNPRVTPDFRWVTASGSCLNSSSYCKLFVLKVVVPCWRIFPIPLVTLNSFSCRSIYMECMFSCQPGPFESCFGGEAF